MSNDGIFGSLVIATWINLILLMIETLQLVACLKQRKKESSIICLVIWCYFLDIACSSANCACVYLYTVTHWGDEVYGTIQHWPMPVIVFTTSSVALTVQAFLILRYFSLSRRIWIAILLFTLSLASTAAAYAVGFIVTTHSSYAARDKVTIPNLFWLSATSVTDWCISGALLWELNKMRSRVALRKTDGMIRRLMLNSIRTGAVTSMLATIFLVNWLADDKNNVSISFGYCLGRVYTITMLYNINYRCGLTESSSKQNTGASSTFQDHRRHIENKYGAGGSLLTLSDPAVMSTGLPFTSLSHHYGSSTTTTENRTGCEREVLRT